MNELIQIDSFLDQIEPAGLDLRDVEKIADNAHDVLACRLHRAKPGFFSSLTEPKPPSCFKSTLSQ
jgi:hypothetical protein